MRMIVTSMLLVLHAVAALAQTGTSAPTAASNAAPVAPGSATRSASQDIRAQCIGMWDAGTHMTKQEWAKTCARSHTRLENLKVEDLDVLGTGVRRRPGGKQGSIDPQTRAN